MSKSKSKSKIKLLVPFVLGALLISSSCSAGDFPEYSGLVNTPAGLLTADDERGDSLLLIPEDDSTTSSVSLGKTAIIGADGQPLGRKYEDFEGLAIDAAGDPSTIYVIASHEPRDGDWERRKKREVLLKLTLEGTSGAYILKEQGCYTKLIGDMEAQISSLAIPGLLAVDQRSLSVPLNIEGLAAHDGRLYFGLRAPLSSRGTAIIASAPANSLFSGTETVDFETTTLDLLGLGIRALEWDSIAGEMLVLAGPPSGGFGRFVLCSWKPRSAEIHLIYEFRNTDLVDADTGGTLQPEGVIRADALRYLICLDGGGTVPSRLQALPAPPPMLLESGS